MSENNVNVNNTNDSNDKDDDSGINRCPVVVYATKEEALAAWTPGLTRKGTKSKHIVFKILQGETEECIGYVWGLGHNDALARWAKAQHNVQASDKNGHAPKPVTEDAATAFLLSLPMEQRIAIMAKLGMVPPAAPTPPVTVAPKKPGKGK